MKLEFSARIATDMCVSSNRACVLRASVCMCERSVYFRPPIKYIELFLFSKIRAKKYSAIMSRCVSSLQDTIQL